MAPVEIETASQGSSGLVVAATILVDPISLQTLRGSDYFYYPFGLAITFVGTVTNLVNMIVFLRVGLSDVVSFSFFTLSVSDFCYSTLTAFFGYGSYLMLIIYPTQPWAMDVIPFAVNFALYSVIFKDTTVVITAYIAVARCCLVALPLQFKSIFTASRTYVSLVTIVLMVAVLHLPMFFTQGIGYVLDPRTNTTRMYIWQKEERRYTLAYNDIVNKNIIPNTSLAVIIVSLIVLSIKLAAASRFRRNLSASAGGHQEEALEKTGENAQKPPGLKSSRLTGKEARVVKAVFSVAALYVVCTLPLVSQSISRLIVPEFNFGKRLQNLYNFVMVFTTLTANFNAAFNICIHFTYNSKFRKVLIDCCRRSSQ